MQHPGLVDGDEGAGRPGRDVEHLVGAERPPALAQHVGQRRPVDQFEHEVRGVVRLEHLEHPHDARVVEPGQGAGLAQEPLLGVGEPGAGLRGREHERAVPDGRLGEELLHRDPALQALVVDLVGDAEATPPEHAAHLEPVDQPGALDECRGGGHPGPALDAVQPRTGGEVGAAVRAPVVGDPWHRLVGGGLGREGHGVLRLREPSGRAVARAVPS
jgi:hypothetical protein